ncbi:diacylglycerol kinase [Ruegeria pomeroyi]|nr:diacylglycerol kinase [Ruegeria pomeroyi]
MRTFFIRLGDRIIWSWAGLVSAELALWLLLGTGERALLLVLGMLVLVAELFNTAIEGAIDYTSNEQHALAGRAKDAASAGVAPAAVAAALVVLVSGDIDLIRLRIRRFLAETGLLAEFGIQLSLMLYEGSVLRWYVRIERKPELQNYYSRG